ncbi:MAG TPA: nuclear transport factor 2 family protein [Pyrinomonadaceae bacterium]|nr:nuclear transport factor 2 family protein [Pyrinomonadaceae bacterium]
MRLLVIVLVILFSSSFTSVHSTQKKEASRTPDETAILQIEETIVKAWLKHDISTIGPLIADDFHYWSPKGERRGKVELLRSATNTEEFDTKVEDAQVKVYGDAAVYTGRITDRGTHDGKPYSVTTCVTDFFVLRDGKWQMVASAEQLVGREPR